MILRQFKQKAKFTLRYQLEINLDCCIQPGHVCWVALKADKNQLLLFAVNFQNYYFCMTHIPRINYFTFLYDTLLSHMNRTVFSHKQK